MRYRLFFLSILPAFAGLATPLASPWDDVRVKHAWKTVPDNWESLGPPLSNITINLHIALKPDNENALIDALYEVSTPGHPKYGAHLSKEGVAELVAPHPNTLELVHSWLAHHGVQSSSISTTHGGNWLTLTGVPVLQANKLLGASYQLYRYAGTNDTAILRTVGYLLPMVLHAHVPTIVPTTLFASSRTLKQTPQMHPVGAGAVGTPAKAALREMPSSRGSEVKPEFLRWLYNTYGYIPRAIAQNRLGVAGYMDEFPSFIDLEWFMIGLRNDAVDATFDVEMINDGEFDPSMPGLEANLNMQYAQAIAYPTPHTFYSIGGDVTWSTTDGQPLANDSDVVWLGHLLSLENKDIPQTISVSYGAGEKIFPPEYAEPVCDLFAQLGARGVSILYASGDHGVGAGDCKDKDGSVKFIPTFPASCPWVTSVGGTRSALPEVGARISGGGFSNIFPRPDYQNVSVPAFIKSLGTKNRGLYNATGRGIPDISAQALKFVVIDNTNAVFMSGTSCATPVVAGIISLLNDFLIAEGEHPLGFLNPWLYGQGKDSLNDITRGSSNGCGGKYGFSAVSGWDPVTGLGTLNFFELLHVLLRTIIMPPANQGRAFSGLLNVSDAAAVPTRDPKELDFRVNSSTPAALKQN